MVSSLAAPQLTTTQLAYDQTGNAAGGQNLFIASDLAAAIATGEATVPEGASFKALGRIEGIVEVRVRTAFGSSLLYAEVTKAALESTENGKGANLSGWKLPTATAEDSSVYRKLLERSASVLDFVAEKDRDEVIEGRTAADSAFRRMMSVVVAEGHPGRIPRGSYKLTAQTSLPSGLTLLLEDGAELFFEDDTLESMLLVEADNVSLYAAAGSKLRGPLTNSPNLTGACIIVRRTSGVRINGLQTQNGKYGLVTLDNDLLEISNVCARNSYNWGIVSAGNRKFRFHNCGTITTRAATASDGFKIVGAYTESGMMWSSKNSYTGELSNPYGINCAAGQAIDIVSATDQNDDLYDIIVVNPFGASCANGLFEIKNDGGGSSFTNWPVHDIRFSGGTYYGDGTEATGGYIAGRVYAIDIADVMICDTLEGFSVGNPARHVKLIRPKTRRTRQAGIKWTAGAGDGYGCVIDNPDIIDPNYEQGASTYSGIEFTNGSHVRVISPLVMRSLVPSGSAHNYGISLSGTTNIAIEGIPSLFAHATGAVNDGGTTTQWPMIFEAEFDIDADAMPFFRSLQSQTRTFYACRITLTYLAASNVARTIQVQGRSSGGSKNIGKAIHTSAAAVLFERTTQTINPPTRVPTTYHTVAAQVQGVTLPHAPTGRVIVTVEGFYDGASAS